MRFLCKTPITHLTLYIALLFSFSLCAKNLNDFHWKNRLLLIKAQGQPELNPLMHQINYRQLSERKLLIFALIEDKSYQLLPSGVMQRKPELDVALGARSIPNGSAILVGLDGGAKAEYKITQLSIEQITSTIDAMPMRQNELNSDWR